MTPEQSVSSESLEARGLVKNWEDRENKNLRTANKTNYIALTITETNKLLGLTSHG